MSPIIHLAPRGFAALVDLDPSDLRVFVAVLAAFGLGGESELRGEERRLARRLGMPRADLRAALVRLAATNPPLLMVRAQGSGVALRLASNPELFVNHGTVAPRRATTKPQAVLMAASLATEIADLEREIADPHLLRLGRGWIAHLAGLGGGSIDEALALLQWATILRLIGAYSAEIAASALESGLKNVRELQSHPERYLLAAARGSAEGGRTGIAKGAELDEVPF